MTRVKAACIAALSVTAAIPSILRSQSQTVVDGASAIQTFVVPTAEGAAAYVVVPVDGVRVVGRAAGPARGETVVVAVTIPDGWPSGRRTAGFLVTGADSLPLIVNVPERRSFSVRSKDAVIRRDGDSVVLEIRNLGNVALRVAADPVASGGWRYGGGAWSVPRGQTLSVAAVFRGRADGTSPSIAVLFRAEGATTRAVPVRVDGAHGLVFPMTLGFGWSGTTPFLALEGVGQVAHGIRVDGAVSLGRRPVVGQYWARSHRNYLSVQLPRFTAAIGEIPSHSADGLVWVPLGLGWSLTAGGPQSRSVEAALGWRDGIQGPAGEFSWHVRMSNPVVGRTRVAGSVFGVGGRTLLGIGDGLFGGAFRVSRMTAAPWSISAGVAHVENGLAPLVSFDARREFEGAAVAVWGRRELSSGGGGWSAATSAGYGVEVKGRAGARLLANGFLFHNDPWDGGSGAKASALTVALRSRPGGTVGGGITGGAYAGTRGRRLSLEASGSLKATRHVQAEAFYRIVDEAAEAGSSGGVRVRLTHSSATGIVGVDYAQESGFLHAGPRVFADLAGRTGTRIQWNVRTNAAAGLAGGVHYEADVAAAIRISESASLFGAAHRTVGEAGDSFSLGLRKTVDVGFPAPAPAPSARWADARGELAVTVRFDGVAGADAPHGAVSLTGPAGTIELPLDRSGRALAIGLPPGLYTVGHIPPANAGERNAAEGARVLVTPGGKSEVVIVAGYQRRRVKVNDLGGP